MYKTYTNIERVGGFYNLYPDKSEQIAWVCEPLSDPQAQVPEMEMGWMWLESAGLRLL